MPARDYFKIGGAMLMAGYGEQALPYLEEASRRSPSNAKTLVAIGRIHLEANRLAPAREALQRATRARSTLPEAWNESGRRRVRGRQSAEKRCGFTNGRLRWAPICLTRW